MGYVMARIFPNVKIITCNESILVVFYDFSDKIKSIAGRYSEMLLIFKNEKKTNEG